MIGKFMSEKEKKVYNAAKEIISDQVGISTSKITLNAHLVDDLEIDSLDLVEIVMCLEDFIEGEITDEVAEKWKCVKDIVKDVSELI